MTAVARLLQEGISHHQAGELVQAARYYREVLRVNPGHGDALHLLGVTEHQAGRHENAIEYIRRAINHQPRSAHFYSNLAAAYSGAGLPAEAIEALRTAVQVDPNFTNGWFNFGTICMKLERFEEAESALRSGLQVSPDHLDSLNNLGLVLQRQKRFVEAERAFRRALEISPRFVAALDNLGVLLQEVDRASESIELHRLGLSLQPKFASGWKNLGNAYRMLDDLESAEACYRSSLSLNGNDADCLSNLGIVLKDLGRPREALAVLDQALTLNSGHVEGHVNRAFVRILLGELAEGWDEAEWRWKVPTAGSISTRCSAPWWNGESLVNKSLLVTAEQGIGDEIFFAECLPELQEVTHSPSNGSRIFIECEARLVPLYRRSMPQYEFLPSSERDRHLEVDYQIPLGSLRRFFRRSFADFPQRLGYLRADEKQVATWRSRYQEAASERGAKLAVGVSWRGGKRADLAKLRSTHLAQWQPIGNVPGVLFVNLQYGNVEQEISEAKKRCDIEIVHWPEADPLRDLDQFAAQISALDLIISIDNTTVHMAGAIGVPVWTMLPFAADYRWFLEREDSPWYPSMRLFRQPRRHDWDSVMALVAESLMREVAGRFPQ